MNDKVEQIEIKIYLKSKRRPFIMVVSSEKRVTELYEMMCSSNIVHFGNIMFPISELKRVEIG